MDDATADILRQMTEVERLAIGARMWNTARALLREAIFTEHPEWDEDCINREIAKRISHEEEVDHELVKRVVMADVVAEWKLAHPCEKA